MAFGSHWDELRKFQRENPEEYLRLHKFVEDTYKETVGKNEFDSNPIVKKMCINYPNPPIIEKIGVSSTFGMVLYEVATNDGWNGKHDPENRSTRYTK